MDSSAIRSAVTTVSTPSGETSRTTTATSTGTDIGKSNIITTNTATVTTTTDNTIEEPSQRQTEPSILSGSCSTVQQQQQQRREARLAYRQQQQRQRLHQQQVRQQQRNLQRNGRSTNPSYNPPTSSSSPMSPLVTTSSSSPPFTPTPSRPRYIPALASCASTPTWAKLCIPILAVFCHVIFYYGQTEPMWKLHANATIDVWANATSYTARRFFQGAGIPYENEFHVAQEEDVQTFTYYFAIHELWVAKDLPGLVIPRLAAILLIVFSGVWPHLKLIMLNLTWFFGKHPIRRTRALQWLSGLGKWSLADVLVVCVMVGVLHLDWIVEPEAIKQGLMTDLPSLMEIVETMYTPEELCNKLLKMDCSAQRRLDMKAKCKTCSLTIGEAYAHPGWAGSVGKNILDGVDTSGGGSATLRVVGMRGIYAFCGAVILSILLSLIVDIFDVKAKRMARQSEEEMAGERFGLRDGERAIRRLRPESAANPSNFAPQRSRRNSHEEGLEEPLLSDASAISATNSLEIDVGGEDGDLSLLSHPPLSKLFSFQFFILSGITAFVVFLGVDMFTMERLVYGAGPKLLSDILGINFEKLYSMRSLMWTTGAAGGWDNMLMGTFGLFCVVGPFVRGVLLAFMVLLDQFKISVSGLATAVSFLGSFCSWEVFAIAIVMVQMLMPTITNTIVQSPVCGQISDDGSCLTVEFNVIPYAFSMLILGGFLLVGLSWTATGRAMKHGEESVAAQGGSSVGNRARTYSALSQGMAPGSNYQRLPNVQEGGSEDVIDDGLEELVFESNQNSNNAHIESQNGSGSTRRNSRKTLPSGSSLMVIVAFLFICDFNNKANPSFLLGCDAKEIEVTNEWQVVGENDTVPAGVHVRMDLSTGEKWVKMASDDDEGNAESGASQRVGDTASSSSVATAVIHEDGSVQVQEDSSTHSDSAMSSSDSNYDFDMMHRTLSKLPDDEKERMGGLPELPQATETKTVTPEQRRLFEARMLEIWKQRQEELAALQEQLMDFPGVLKERIKSIDEYLKDPSVHLEQVDLEAELPEGVVTHIVSVLDDLQFQVTDVDMARDFHTMGGWALLASLVSEDSHIPVNKTIQALSPTTGAKIRTIQSLAAETIGTAVKNTEEFFPYAVEQITVENGSRTTTALDLMIDVFCQNFNDDMESLTLSSKSIYAIGAMLRGNRLAQSHVLQHGGFERLGRAYKDLSSQDKISPANVKLVLRLSSLVSDIIEDVQLHPDVGDTPTNRGIIAALTSAEWCDALHQSLTSKTLLPMKAQESILHSVKILSSYCQWTINLEAMKSTITAMKAEWESKKDSMDDEHFHQLVVLAEGALAAIGTS